MTDQGHQERRYLWLLGSTWQAFQTVDLPELLLQSVNQRTNNALKLQFPGAPPSEVFRTTAGNRIALVKDLVLCL